MQDNKQIKVLFLPAWYPHKNDSMFGLFVRQHALALKPHADVTVVNLVQVEQQVDIYKVETNVENQLTEINLYYRRSRLPIAPLRKIQNIFRYLKGQKAAWHIVKASDLVPDICHVHILTRAGLLAYRLKKKYKIPYVITEHWSRYLPHNDHFKGFLHKKITQKIMNSASAMTTVSDLLKQAMHKKGLQHDNWSLLPNVIDVKRFTPRDKKPTKGAIKIFHLSCFEDHSKNISGLLRAFKEACDARDDLELIMIGDGPDWNQMKQYSSEIGIPASKISFTGVLEGDDLIHQMNACDFSLLFSNFETFGIVVLESITLGKPVVTSKAGAIPEILPAKYSIQVEIGDEKAFAQGILKMADSYLEYDIDEMHAYVAEHYDDKVVGYQLKQLYDKCLG
jgi:glycosyltransferase involved in cell wall biosynthesis